MPLPITHINSGTPMGATLVADGVAFRVWAPSASAVYVNGIFSGAARFTGAGDDTLLLQVDDPSNANKRWIGFLQGAQAGDQYKFYIVGPGASGHKRDPYARELTTPENFAGSLDWPACNCIVRSGDAYPWRSSRDFRRPRFNDLIIYQFHMGTFAGPDDRRAACRGSFLDAAAKVEHLVRLGVNAIEPLPITEASGKVSIGYNGSDYFSPEMAYTIPEDDLDPHVEAIGRLLENKGQARLAKSQLVGGVAQLKAMVDVFHLYGIAVIFDVVYNHAGGFDGDNDGLYFFDLRERPGREGNDNNRSLYFTDRGIAGGLAFAFHNRDVRQFLIDNARFLFGEYRIDGLRFDLVNEIDNNGGAGFCHDLTGTLRYIAPQAPLIAEYWNDNRARVVQPATGGLGFDAAWSDRLRDELWAVVSAAAGGASAYVGLGGLAGALDTRAHGFPDFWRAVTYIENHDEQEDGRKPRTPTRADASDRRSWYARSRSRVANAILLTAPGIPLLFMGQEFLEDKQWNENGRDHLIFFDGLDPDSGQQVMQDFYRFMQELVALRRRQPALRSEQSRVPLARDLDRVLVMHRWIEGYGRDALVVISLNERTFNEPDYQLGFPSRGRWEEVFNSDSYDDIGLRQPYGNGGHIIAEGPPLDGFSASAGVIIPANGVVVFARDYGDL